MMCDKCGKEFKDGEVMYQLRFGVYDADADDISPDADSYFHCDCLKEGIFPMGE